MTSSVAAIKLVEFGARSMLILLCIYLMPAAEAARFGTVMLFVGFFSFLVGQERYVDLQRRISALSHVDAGAAIISYGRLISVGYLLGIPLLYVLLREFAGVTNQEALLAVMVAVVEHLSQECYRIVLITDRHRVLLFGSAAKTVVVLAVVSVIAIIRCCSGGQQSAVCGSCSRPSRFDVWCSQGRAVNGLDCGHSARARIVTSRLA